MAVLIVSAPPVAATELPEFDLHVTKSAAPTAVAPGDSVVFTVTVQNLGPETAFDVTMTDTMPADTTAMATTASAGTCSQSTGASVSCEVDVINVGDTVTYEITATVPATPGTIENTAVANSVDPDQQPDNNSSTAEVLVATPSADLAIVKSPPHMPAAPGDDVIFSMLVTNGGPFTATGVEVTDPVPPGTTYVDEGSTEACALDEGVVTCPVGDLASGGSTSVFIKLTAADEPGTLTNTASVVADAPQDTHLSNNSSTANADIVDAADLSIMKTDDADPVGVGDAYGYDLHVMNHGPSDARNVTITDVLPAGVGFVDATSDAATCGHDGGTVTCTVAMLESGGEIHVDLAVTAPNIADVVTNTANVSAENESAPESNTDTEETQVLESGADLSIGKSAAQTVEVGAQFDYTITVHNAGPDAAENVEVRDVLPASLTLGSATTDAEGGSCSGDPEVVCALGTLDVGGSASVTIGVTAPADPGQIPNTATVSTTTGDPDTTDNSGEHTVAVTNEADVSISKSAEPSEADLGGTVTYTLTATNNGPVTAQGVVVTDALPAGATYVSDDQDACTHDAGTNNVTCTAGSLGVFDSFSVQIVVTVPNEDLVLYNNGLVSAASPDPQPENDSTVHSLVVGEPDLADLSSSAFWDLDPVAAGQTANLSLQVSNNGPDIARSVHATLTVPEGLTLTLPGGGEPTAGARRDGSAPACTQDGATYSCDIGDIGPFATFSASFPGSAATAGVYNVRVHAGTSLTGDPNIGNNSTTATLHVLEADAADLFLSAFSPGTGAAGDPQPYHFFISNQGPATATGVEVVHTIPAGATFSIANIEGGICEVEGGVVTCEGPDLAPFEGVSGVIEIVPGAPGTLTAGFTATGDGPDPDTDNNEVVLHDEILAEGAADLSVDVFGPSEVASGTPSDFYVYASNHGPTTATGVGVEIEMPAGWTGSASWYGGECTGTGATLQCPIGELGVGYYEYITLTATPGDPLAGSTRNFVTQPDAIMATIDGEGDDPNADNDVSSFEVTRLAEGTAQLSLQKFGPERAAAGEPFSFFLSGTNFGPSDAEGATLVDELPDGLAFVSATTSQGTCSHDGGTVTCDLGTLQRHHGVWAEITVTAGAQGEIENTATLSSDGPDPDDSDNTDSHGVSVLAAGAADVMISKFGEGDGAVDSPYTYAMNVHNAGPATATEVTVTDVVPEGMTIQSVNTSHGSCSTDGNTVTCAIGELPVFHTAYVQIVVTPNAAGTVTNTATVSAAGEDPNDDNNSSAVEAQFFAAGATDLEISKSASSYASAEQPMSFSISVFNNGPSPAGQVVVSDTLPSGFTFDSAYASQGVCSFASATRTVTCRLGTLGLFRSGFISINAIPAAAGTFTNTATVTHGEEDLDDDDNRDDVEFEVGAAGAIDVAIVKSGQRLAVAGANYRYTLDVTNYGYTPAHDVVVTDPLPSGMTFVSGTWSGGECTFANGTVTCDLGDIPSGQTVRIALTVVPQEVDEDVDNTARVSTSSEDYYPDDDEDAHEISVVPPGSTDLAVDKYGWSQDAEQNEQFAYYISIANNGPSAAPNVIVEDAVPASMTISSAYASTGECDIVLQVVTCNLGTLGAYEYGWVGIYVIPTATGTIRNTATVTSDATDETEANDSDTFEVEVFAEGTADLAIEKMDVVDPAIVNEVMRYGIVVENRGPGNAPNAVIRDNLPDGVEFIAANPSQGACSHAAGVVTCELGTVYNWWTVYIEILVRPTALGSIVNTAAVSHSAPTGEGGARLDGDGGLDPDASNNTDRETTTIVEDVTGSPSAQGGQVSTDEETGEVTVSMGRGAREDVVMRVEAGCPDGSTPSEVTLSLGTFQVTMTHVSGSTYEATIPADEVTNGTIVVTVVCGDEPIPNPVGQIVLYDPSGFVTNAVTGAPVVGATVIVHNVPGWRARTGPADTAPDTCESNDSKAEGATWSQVAPVAEGVVEPALSGRIDPATNPQLTDDVGHYGWDVAAGCWYVTVAKAGFATLTSPVVGVPPEVTDLDLELTPLSLGITVPTTPPVYGKSFTISGVTSPAVAGCRSRSVQLQRDAVGGAVSFVNVGTPVTSNATTGRFSKAFTATGALGATGTWRAVAAETGACGAITSAAKLLKVAKAVTLKASSTSVRSGTTVTLTAKVAPCGTHARKNVTLQKKVGSRWVNVKTVRTNSSCVAAFAVKILATTIFRVTSPADDADHAAGTSLPVTVRKR